MYFSCNRLLLLYLDERSDILIDLNLGLCETLETSIFSNTQIIHLIVLTLNVKKLSDFVPYDCSRTVLPPLKHGPSYGLEVY